MGYHGTKGVASCSPRQYPFSGRNVFMNVSHRQVAWLFSALVPGLLASKQVAVAITGRPIFYASRLGSQLDGMDNSLQGCHAGQFYDFANRYLFFRTSSNMDNGH